MIRWVRRKEKDVKEKEEEEKEDRSGGHFFDGFKSCKLSSATAKEEESTVFRVLLSRWK